MLARMLMVIVLLCGFTDALAASRGGSNFHFYQLDGCFREDYGVLKNYHTARAAIDTQLIAMRSGGQDRLRLGIYHTREGFGGTVISSNGGNIDPQYRQNLADLLATVKQLGYAEIIFSFFPLGPNSPVNWGPSFYEDAFQENWNLIANIVPILEASGLPYVVDLGNELSPPAGSAYSAWNTYVKRMWGNYVYVFGNTKTVGFSLVSEAGRADNMRNIYGNNPPHVFQVHAYETPYNTLIAMDRSMDAQGYRVQGWIIGETFYNDAYSASQISAAISNSGRIGHFLVQWPITSAKYCADVDVVPLSFDNYINYGF